MSIFYPSVGKLPFTALSFIKLHQLCTWFFLLVLPLAYHAAAQPTITSFSPASGPAGTSVTITGSNFNPTPVSNIVYFGAVQGTVTGGSATSLSVTVSAGATYEPLSVLNTATGLTGYASRPFALTFTNLFGTGLPDDYYLPKVPFTTDYAPSGVALSDLDGDGKSDMVVTSFGNIAVLRNISSTSSITPASFASQVRLPNSTIPDIVVVKDIDGDGKPDIVGSSGYNNTVSVWRNVSSPGSITTASFTVPVTLTIAAPLSIYQSSLAIGDLDGDGKPDLAVTLNPNQPGALAVFRNTSTPGNLTASSFARAEVPTAAFPSWVAINDIDGDGKADLVTANKDATPNSGPDGKLSVLRNKAVAGSISAASFEPPVDFAVGSNYRSLAVGDIDGDGKPDLVTRSGSTAISVLRNTSVAGTIGAASFSPRADFPFSASGVITLGDVNGDGKADILASGSGVLSVLRNTTTTGSISTASFAPKKDFASSDAGTGSAVGDLNGDGFAEVVITNNSSSTVSVLRVNSAPATPPQVSSFSPIGGSVGTTVTIMGSGFDASPSGNLVFFGAVKASVVGASSTSLTVLVPAGATYQPLSVLNRSTGLTAYSSALFIPTFNNPFGSGIPANFYRPKTDFATPGIFTYSVAFGDIDGDGKPDMLSVNETSGVVSVMRNASATGTIEAGSFNGRVDFTTAPLPRKVAVSDWDGDGKPDIIVLSPASNTVSILRNTAAAPGPITAASFAAPRIDLNIGVYISSFAVADLDLDGKPDLVLTTPYNNSAAVVTNTNLSFGVTYFSLITGMYPRAVAVSDVDGDGKPDIVVANERSNTVSVIRNRTAAPLLSNISFAPRVDFPAGTSPVDLAISDADGDGKPEIVVANFVSSTLSVLRNTATAGDITTASFAPAVDFVTGTNPYAMAAGDADGDGKPDLITANTASNTVSVLRNTAVPGSITAASFAGRSDFSAGIYPLSVALGDLNGDGIAELAAANAGSGNISVFKIREPSPTFAAAESTTGTSVQVYPNPTTGSYTVQLSGLEASAATIEILSKSGHPVERRIISPDGKTPLYALRFSLRNYPAGIYYVKLTSAHGVQVTKLVVQP